MPITYFFRRSLYRDFIFSSRILCFLFFLFFCFFLYPFLKYVGVMRYLDVAYCFRFDIFMCCLVGSVCGFVCLFVCVVSRSGEPVTRYRGSSVRKRRLLMLFMCSEFEILDRMTVVISRTFESINRGIFLCKCRSGFSVIFTQVNGQYLIPVHSLYWL